MNSGIIFDLDGTLLYTLTDIGDSVNFVLEKKGYITHNIEKYSEFVGNGMTELVRKAFDLKKDDLQILKYTNEVKEKYFDICTKNSYPYSGIIDVLNKLKLVNIPFGIVTNKPQFLAEKLVTYFFDDLFRDNVIGSESAYEKKPSIEGVKEMGRKLIINPEKSWMVGDMGIDIETAFNYGMKSAWVSWGYEIKKNIKKYSPVKELETPFDILNLIKK